LEITANGLTGPVRLRSTQTEGRDVTAATQQTSERVMLAAAQADHPKSLCSVVGRFIQ
jgi:hypothetical protein